MKSSEQRINNIIGQLEGVKKMVSEKKDCVQVLIQMKAVKSAMDSLTAKLLEENISNCVIGLKGAEKKRMMELIKEITKI